MADGGRIAGPKCIALTGPFASGKTTLLEAILDQFDLVSIRVFNEGNDPRAALHGTGLAHHAAAARLDLVTLGQQHGDVTLGVQDALALNLGGVRREHRADVGAGQRGGDVRGAVVGTVQALPLSNPNGRQ